MSVLTDDRWSGNHGIGRYATEVLARLTVPRESMGLDGRPSDPFDAFRHRGVVRGRLSYSPGYNAFTGGGRQILTIHDLIHLTSAWPAKGKYLAYYNSVVRPVVRSASVVMTDSEASTRAIREWVRDDRVEIVNGAAGCSPVFRREGESYPFTRPTLLAVGNSRAHKNLPTFLKALERTSFGGVMVVPAADLAAMKRAADEFGVGDRVEVVSGVTDEQLASMYRGAAATVFPSLLEGFGLPALESVRAGTPVVYWRGCESVGEIVAESGVAVETRDDPAEWASAFEHAADMSVADLPADVFTWDATARVVDEQLARALARAA